MNLHHCKATLTSYYKSDVLQGLSVYNVFALLERIILELGSTVCTQRYGFGVFYCTFVRCRHSLQSAYRQGRTIT